MLYEATQGPLLPLEQPQLNPIPGVKGNPGMKLVFQPDPTRPGDGVFVARPDAAPEVLKENVALGTIVVGEDNGETEDHQEQERISSPSIFAPPPGGGSNGGGRPPLQTAGSSGGDSGVLVTPLSTNFPNVNPALNAGMPAGGEVQIMNMLGMETDPNSAASEHQQAMMTLEQLAGGSSILEGMPGGMFDWGEFSGRFPF